MLDLQPLIARFVDDVLRTIRTASLDELRALLGEDVEVASAPRVKRSARKPRRRAARAHVPVRAPSRAEEQAREDAAPTPEPPAQAEITDPEALLAAATGSPAPSAAPEPSLVLIEGGGDAAPSSTERPLRRATRLRAGESLAREVGTGVVIRRAKRQ